MAGARPRTFADGVELALGEECARVIDQEWYLVSDLSRHAFYSSIDHAGGAVASRPVVARL
jgi:hypothetical protein